MRSFRSLPWPALAAILSIALFLRLGYWQLARAEERRESLQLYQERSLVAPRLLTADIAATEKPGDWTWRRVRVQGHFDTSQQVLLDNEVDDQGRVGYRVYTPLDIGAPGDRKILVDRGCVPIVGARAVVPELQTPNGPVELQGQIAPWPRPGLLLRGALEIEALGQGVLRAQVLDRLTLEKRLGGAIAPYVLRLAPDSPHAYRQGPPLAAGTENRHKAYALQWFALALATIVTYLVHHFRGAPEPASPAVKQ